MRTPVGRLFAAFCATFVAGQLLTVLPAPAKKNTGGAAPAANSAAAPAAGASTTKKDISLSVVSISSPVKAGSDATATIKTEPNAMCNITVKYKSGPATAAGLKSQRADKDGKATWTWKVAKNCSPGDWPVDFTASLNRAKASGSGTLKVEK